MNDIGPGGTQVAALDIPLERDVFMRTLVRELANVLEEVVGIDEASGFISVVGQLMGREINEMYRAALKTPELSREQVAAVLVDLKQRIRGDFFVVEQDDDRIVLASRSCPFAEKVHGQRSICMMTSNVFGSIAADNLGYAKVHLAETVAAGGSRCRVVVYLKSSAESDSVDGREYFRALADDR